MLTLSTRRVHRGQSEHSCERDSHRTQHAKWALGGKAHTNPPPLSKDFSGLDLRFMLACDGNTFAVAVDLTVEDPTTETNQQHATRILRQGESLSYIADSRSMPGMERAHVARRLAWFVSCLLGGWHEVCLARYLPTTIPVRRGVPTERSETKSKIFNYLGPLTPVVYIAYVTWAA